MGRQHYARIGAAVRLGQLAAEVAAIKRAFPGITVDAVEVGVKRTFSAAAKKRMSAGMRRYWAKRRAAGKMRNKRKGSHLREVKAHLREHDRQLAEGR